jgi:signal transduction histidine kinase
MMRRNNIIIDHMTLIWAVVFYLSVGISVAGALSEGVGPLLGWRGAAILLLLAGCVVLFQALFMPFFKRPVRAWPMSWQLALAYFGGEALILAGLMALDANFIGLAFAFMGQTFGALRPRQWPLPLLIYLALLSHTIGLLDAIMAGQWLGAVSLLFTVSVLVLSGLMISQLIAQRYELMHLVGELRRAKAAVEAGAAEQEELAMLRERTRLAREMHDSIGHALVLVNVKLEAAQRLYARDPARGDAELEATRGLVRETMAELRRSLADLRAPLPDHHDLPAALRRLAAEVSARGRIAVSAEGDLHAPGPPPAVAEALWAIAREAVRNAERHAAAASATIRLNCADGCWRLLVSDDGSGVSSAAMERPGHFGVLGMRERAEALSGSLTIARRPGGGTVVEARIPA